MNCSKFAILSRYIFPVIYGAFFVLLFFSAYKDLLVWWGKSDYNYCAVVPVVAAYLLWERRRALLLLSIPSFTGVVVVALGLFLYLLGELGGHLFSVHLSSWIILVGLLWLHFGWFKLRALAFPIGILPAMFPLPSVVNTAITSELKLISSDLGVKILRLSGVAVFQDGNIIDLGFTSMELVQACSGLRYFFPLILVAILLAAQHKARLWQGILLVLSATPFSILTNSMRIAGMGWLYPVMGDDIIDGFWHESLGLLLFMLTIGCLLVGMRFLLWLAPMKPERSFQESPPVKKMLPESRSVLPLALLTLVMLAATATATQTIDFRERMPLVRPMTEFPMIIGEWHGRETKLEQIYLDELKLTDYLQADYVNGKGKSVGIYVGYYESQTKEVSSHSPEVCLPGSGWIFKDSDLVSAPVGPRGAIAEVRRVLMEKNGEKNLMYYWYSQRGRVLDNPFQLKWYIFVDAISKQRTDGALVRLFTTVHEREKPEDAEARLQSFVYQVGPRLNSFLPGE